MSEEKNFSTRFNSMLHEEMSSIFEITPLPLKPDFAVRHSTEKNRGALIRNDHLACPKTGGIRMGEMDYGGNMTVHFGSIPPRGEYNFPILGYTFAYASKFLIAVLDLHPLRREKEYRERYIEPLREVSEEYHYIP